ncbi:MAG: glycosyltransferase [Proteobacteria bacterium]|nr:glycosyltransferase [Pseudomonadota bacterium]MBU1595431.1 glycosyltransferase [Pseudomonadota bacterium]
MSHSIPVLCYHNVSLADGHTPERFEEHLAAIRDAGFSTISARALLAALRGAAPAPARACVLTFDDCHLSNWTVAAPLLARYGMTGVFFCVTDFIGAGAKRPQLAEGAGGPELLSAPESFRRALEAGDLSQFLNEAELRALGQDYGFEVYAHSARHQGAFRSLVKTGDLAGPQAHWSAWGIYSAEQRQGPQASPLPQFETGSAYAYNGYWPVAGSPAAGGGLYYRRRSDAERRAFCLEDFRRCHARMRDINGFGEEQSFCWPWGQYDALAQSCLREAGFNSAFTLERSANVRGSDPLRIHRIGVGKAKDGRWIESRLRMYSGALSSRLFFKFLRKRPEVASVLYMTDSEKLSGGSRQMVNNILGMRESGLRITAVIPPGSEIRAALTPLATGWNPVEIVEYDGFRRYVRAASFVADLARRVQADVVHTFHAKAYKSAALAKLTGARFALFVNRGVIFPPNTIFALYCLLAQGVTCNSLRCCEVLRKYQVPQSRLRLVYNSFLPDAALFHGGLPPERQARRKRGVRVLYVGNEAPAKGLDVFLRLAAELVARGVRDLEFVAAGVRNMKPFDGLVTPELRLRLALPGHLPHEGVLRELKDADILVLPSRQESLPNVLLEAFACSLPVVVTDVGGLPELVHHGVNGFVLPSEDASGLADAVAALAADPVQRLRMGRINRQMVARHLGNAAKTLTLLRVYFGEALFEPLPIEDLARQVDLECSLADLEEGAPCSRSSKT